MSVLTGRALADATLMLWSLVTTTAFGFIVGFRLTGPVPDALAAFGLCVLFGLAFEWVFIVIGLVAGTSQGAQSMGLIVVPLIFLSSAYVPSTGMSAGVKQFPEYEPLTPMVNSVGNLAMGSDAGAAPAQHRLPHRLVACLDRGDLRGIRFPGLPPIQPPLTRRRKAAAVTPALAEQAQYLIRTVSRPAAACPQQGDLRCENPGASITAPAVKPRKAHISLLTGARLDLVSYLSE